MMRGVLLAGACLLMVGCGGSSPPSPAAIKESEEKMQADMQKMQGMLKKDLGAAKDPMSSMGKKP